MKQLFSILPISIAILLITVFSIVPHHHHKEVLCMVIEMCMEDNTINDQHTTHDTSGENAEHGHACITNAQYTAPTHVLKGSFFSEDGSNQQAVYSLYLLASYLLYTPELPITRTVYGEYTVSYEFAPLGLCSGLRAPPYYLS
jgi:hypothetical membrane protein|nr:DUF6769 family protein [Bacteroides intestinalis]